MVDVLLIDVSGINQKRIGEPNGISYICSYLRKDGYNVRIIEPSVNGDSCESVISEIIELNPRVLGLSISQDKDVYHSKLIIDKIKEKKVNCRIVIGGHSASIAIYNEDPYYYELLKKVDCAIIGDGEIIFSKVVKCIDDSQDFKDIGGLAFWEDGIKINKNCDYCHDLDSLPFQSRDVYEQLMEKYKFPITASMVSSRGCYHNICTFCSISSYSKMIGQKVRYRSIENIISEIKMLKEKYNVEEIIFDDDNFIAPGEFGEKRILEFCDALKSNNIKIKFGFECRINDISFNTFKLLKEAGLTTIFIGVEAYENKSLKFFGKGYTEDDVIKSYKILNDLGFSFSVDSKDRVYAGLILWHPKLNIDMLEKTFECYQRFELPIKHFLNKLSIYSNSPLEKYAIKQNCPKDENNCYIWKYEEAYMHNVEELITNFIKRAMDTRDRIRICEKTNAYDSNTIEEMKEYRKRFDKMCCDFIRECINSYKSEGNYNPDSKYKELSELEEESKNKFGLEKTVFLFRR